MSTPRKKILWLEILGSGSVGLFLAEVLYGNDCAQYVQNPANLINAPQALVEDCMRTGYAQAIATALTASIAGGLIASQVGQALGGKPPDDKSSDMPKKTNYFRMRIHRGGDVGFAIGGGFLTLIIEEWNGTEWGSARYLTYKGLAFPYVGLEASVTSSSSEWKEFTTPVPMTAGEFAGAGSVTYWPNVSLGPWGANAGVTLNFVAPNGKPFSVWASADGSGLGASFVSHFWMGGWSVK